MRESEPQSDESISPEQADAFAAELAPGWASGPPGPPDDAEKTESTAPLTAPEPPPVKPAGVASPQEDQTEKSAPASRPSPQTVADEALTQPSFSTPEQEKTAATDFEVVEMRRAAAAPPTVQVRAPEYDDEPVESAQPKRVLGNIALILLGIGVGVASVVVYLEVRETSQPPNANKGFETAVSATPAASAPQAPPPTSEPTQQAYEQPQPLRGQGIDEVADPSAKTEEVREDEEIPALEPAKPMIVLHLKTTPPDATVTLNGQPFENPFEGELDQGGEHLFVARARGYETERLRVRFDSDRRVHLELSEKRDRASAKPRRRAGPQQRPKNVRRATKPATSAPPASRKKPATFVTDNPY